MAFKMKGFNPGKGTGISNGFSRVTLNPNTRDDPNAAEYIEWYTNKYGRPPILGMPEDNMSGPVVDNETREDLKNKEKASETNEMMFEDLKDRLEEYKNDPYKVQILPQGAKLTIGDFKDWKKSNEKQIRRDGLRDEEVRRLFRDKMIESRNIDNDLRLSAEQGYGFDENQLANYGVYGDDFNIDQDQFDGGDNVVSLDVSEYAPDPTRAANLEKNKENLNIENLKHIGNRHMDNIQKAIKEGRDIPVMSLSWLASRGPKNDIPEFNKFIYDYVMPYQRYTQGGSKKDNKMSDQLQNLLDSGMSIDQAYANLNITAPSTEGKIINFSDDTRPSKMGGRLLDKFENNRFVKSDDFLYPDVTKPGPDSGLDLSADNNVEYEDDITRDMDKMIAEQEQTPAKEKTPAKEETPVKEEEVVKKEPVVKEEPVVEAEQSFDPRDTNKDGVVDRKEKRAAMFADAADPQSAMTKAILMNADSNPFKFGSKEHEEYTNNKNRAQGLAIKQRYNKFL